MTYEQPTTDAPFDTDPTGPLGQVGDKAAAYLRTVWPMVLGHAAAFLVAAIATRWHVQISEGWVFEAVSLAAGTAVYGGGRWLEHRTGTGWLGRTARWVGRWVLSVGIHTGTPVYVPQAGTGR